MNSRPALVKTCLPAFTLALCLAAGHARASELRGDIEEVVAGAFGRPEIQYVELRTDTCFALPWAGVARLAFYDHDDHEVGAFVFPSDPPETCDGPISVLVGTPAYASLPSAPDPDFLMAPLLVPDSGKVCFEVPVDGTAECLTYGSFTGVTNQQSPFNAPALSAGGTCALRIANPAAFFTFEPFNADYDLLPPEPRNSAGQTGGLDVPPRFVDVPAASPFQPFVEALFNAGVTGGCGPAGNLAFCPSAPVSREQMALFLLLAKEGPAFQPPACASPVFADVPCANPFASWINELAARGITGGCGGGNYCPDAAVSRAQVAVFLLLMDEGPGFQPPACTSPVFTDVPCSDPFAPWINELAARGVTGGCGGGAYCPDSLVTREQMAVFLSTVFELPVPSRSCILPPLVDDHGDTPEAATPVVPLPAAPGLQVAGTLERPRDVDVFSFSALGGEAFTFALPPTPLGGPRIVLTLSDAALMTSSPFRAEIAEFTAPHDGTFFFAVRETSNREIMGYEVFVRGPIVDDHADLPASATPVTVGGPSVTGEIERPSDVDFFSFAATAGEVYVVETIGDDPAMKTLLRITGEDHALVAVNGLASGPQAQAAFRAPTTGTFFVIVSHSFGEVGTYELRVRGPLADDHGDTPATATPLASGVPVNGEALPEDDLDLFSFTAAAGDAFFVDVEILAPSPSFWEAIVVDAAGDVQEVAPVEGDDTRVSFAPPVGGTFFVLVRPLSASPVSYRVTLEGPLPDDHGDSAAMATPLTPGTAASPFTPGNNEILGDVDVFSFPVTAGGVFFVEVEPAESSSFPFTRVFEEDGTELLSGDDLRLVVTAPENGTLFVSVQQSFHTTGTYRIRVRGPIVDDHGSRPSQSTPLTPNAPPLPAELELSGDVDLFSFEALAGETFVVKVQTGEGVACFCGMTLELLGVNGLTVLETAQGSFFSFFAHQILFQAPQTGRFFVRVSGSPQLYRISLAGPFPDDHGNTAEAATLLAVDGPAEPGVIESVEDVDAFAFDAVAGETVTVETSGLGQGLDTLLTVETSGGTVLASDDDGGVDLGSRITFTAPSTGRYVARVSSFPGTNGVYHISVRR